MKPFISIVVASYNYEKYLGSCLNSILSQDYQNFEVIVVDDGSKDGSVSLAKSFATRDSRIKVYQHKDKKNHGLVATLSLAFSLCTGEYIAFLESDDLWESNCLSERIALLDKQPNCGLIFNDVTLLLENDTQVLWYKKNIEYLRSENRKLGYCENTPNPFNYGSKLLIANQIPTFSCVMFKKSLIDRIDFKPPVAKWADWWLWVYFSKLTDCMFLDEKLTVWRIHQNSFNHKLPLKEYMKNNRLMWESFRAISKKTEDKKEFILNLPAYVRLVARLASMMFSVGITNTIRVIGQKFHKV